MRSLTLLVLVLSAFASPALGKEIWKCEFPADQAKYGLKFTQYELRGKQLMEIGQPYRRYNILIDNKVGIVAVLAESLPPVPPSNPVLPPNPAPVIGADVFVIDRKSGSAMRSYTYLTGKPTPADRGNCHRD
jgi:hypothetical protein